MVPLSNELVCKDPDIVVTDQCAPILGPSVDVVPDNQPQQSLGLMGPIGKRDVVEERGDDIEIFHPTLYSHALFCILMT